MAKKPYLEFSVEDRNLGSYVYRWKVKHGEIEPKSKEGGCEACGQTEGQIENHREDYSSIDPNELITLCCRCHRVLHLRDSDPSGWDFYRERILEGYRWEPEKRIAFIINEMKFHKLDRASKVNVAKEYSVLDDIEKGAYLKGTQEERRKRMDELVELAKTLKSGGQSTLW